MNKKCWAVQNFARYDSLATFLTRSGKNLAPSHFCFGVQHNLVSQLLHANRQPCAMMCGLVWHIAIERPPDIFFENTAIQIQYCTRKLVVDSRGPPSLTSQSGHCYG